MNTNSEKRKIQKGEHGSTKTHEEAYRMNNKMKVLNHDIEIHIDGEIKKLPDYLLNRNEGERERMKNDNDAIPGTSGQQNTEVPDKGVKEDTQPELKDQEEILPPNIPGEFPVYNTRALSKHEKTYRLERFEKNAMIIFNFENLDEMKKRLGTAEDEKALIETFSKFNFEIEAHPDCTKIKLFKKLKKFSEKDFTNYGCIAVVILTHGAGSGLLRAKDFGQLYSEQDILDQFKVRNKPTLVTKPILLLIQACRGEARTDAAPVMQPWKIYRDHDDKMETYHLPLESDMLVVHSSFAGKPAFRPNNGSWFIQTLCSRIDELFLTHDLESIMTEMKRDIAVNNYYMEFNKTTGEMDIHKQMPVVTSTLIRKLFLRKFKDSPPLSFHHMKMPSLTIATMGDAAPNTPIFCTCFLDHFEYMKKCLGHFVQENPKDKQAKNLLNIADLESGVNEEKAKATLIAISDYLQKYYKNSKYLKYMHFYENGVELDMTVQREETKSSSSNAFDYITNNLIRFRQNYVKTGVVTCLGVLVIYNFIRK